MYYRPSRLERTQVLPISKREAWDFFSSPSNLAKITPDYMDFTVHTPEKDIQRMYQGLMISYTVRPVLGFPMQWTTEITHVQEQHFFVDQQIIGPYKLWHHQHHFKEVDEGVMMTDIVHYALTLGPFGWLARKLFVERQLESIFDYRYDTISNIFLPKAT